MNKPRTGRDAEALDLMQEATYVLEEARMVLPGIQALFGFQLVAVFSDRFSDALSRTDQIIHLAALVLAAISSAMLMTPAAYHRLAERGQVSERFIWLSSRLITFGMVPLAGGMSLDVYLVAHLVLRDEVASIAISAGLCSALCGLWFLYPRIRRPRRAP